ncbi:MAG: helix-turn-helix domain-containing protein [Chloroflexota bacterium]
MVKPKDKEKQEARRLRNEGWSYNQIAKELDISKSSAHNWCHDIELTPEQKTVNKERGIYYGDNNKGAITNKKRALEARKVYQSQGRLKARENNRLHITGCMMYWAEGAKYRRNIIIFANSDVEMIKVFAQFLRQELDVSDEQIKVKVHCHTTDADKIATIENYWLNLLGLPRDNLHKTQIVKSSGRSKNRLEYGVCTLTVQSTELLQHIYGAIQEYGNFTNEDWLY